MRGVACGGRARKARFLRVIQQDSTTFTLGCKAQQPGDTQTLPNMLGGPPLSLTVVDGIKRILGSVPLESDGSVCLQVPPCRAAFPTSRRTAARPADDAFIRQRDAG